MFRRRIVAASLALLTVSSATLAAQQPQGAARAVEARVPIGAGASLYARTIGSGQPVIVLHGGPDFDMSYLLPDLDQFSDLARLVYYDQRGRGRSAAGVQAEDVTLASELADIDAVRRHFGLAAPVTLLGHSWGAVHALEYALKHPDRVRRIILMNPAPVSTSDVGVLRRSYLAQLGDEMAKQQEIAASDAYKAGDPATVAARYRIHFKFGTARAEHRGRLMERMSKAFVAQGAAGILKARAVEDRLMLDTWAKPDYDLLPKLEKLRVPTLVIVGDKDFIPPEIAKRIAGALPRATLVEIPNCGHFSYMECPADVRRALESFLRGDR